MAGKYRKFTPEFREEAARTGGGDVTADRRMLPASSGSMRPRLVTGCGITARSTRMMSLRCSCPSGRGCVSWNVRTVSCG